LNLKRLLLRLPHPWVELTLPMRVFFAVLLWIVLTWITLLRVKDVWRKFFTFGLQGRYVPCTCSSHILWPPLPYDKVFFSKLCWGGHNGGWGVLVLFQMKWELDTCVLVLFKWSANAKHACKWT
jgi:hypothetical protein